MTRAGTIEKVIRLASFVAMLIAGLRREEQELLWISDHDETLDTFERREQLGRLVSYLTFDLVGWRNPANMHFGTTETPNIPSWTEDAAAIPDILAGAFCQLSSILPTELGTETWTRVISSNISRDERARLVGDWMATSQGNLRIILLRLELNAMGVPRTSAQFFKGAIRR
jgi:hypothetical protein